MNDNLNKIIFTLKFSLIQLSTVLSFSLVDNWTTSSKAVTTK